MIDAEYLPNGAAERFTTRSSAAWVVGLEMTDSAIWNGYAYLVTGKKNYPAIEPRCKDSRTFRGSCEIRDDFISG